MGAVHPGPFGGGLDRHRAAFPLEGIGGGGAHSPRESASRGDSPRAAARSPAAGPRGGFPRLSRLSRIPGFRAGRNAELQSVKGGFETRPNRAGDFPNRGFDWRLCSFPSGPRLGSVSMSCWNAWPARNAGRPPAGGMSSDMLALTTPGRPAGKGGECIARPDRPRRAVRFATQTATRHP